MEKYLEIHEKLIEFKAKKSTERITGTNLRLQCDWFVVDVLKHTGITNSLVGKTVLLHNRKYKITTKEDIFDFPYFSDTYNHGFYLHPKNGKTYQEQIKSYFGLPF